MKTISAVYEAGVFRPLEPVDLPEGAQVEFEPRAVADGETPPELDAVYSILNKRFNSGESHVAARHNEHQP